MKDKIKFPWVLWFSISKRKQWFSYWWRTRGANYVEFQVWIFRITIGMPWINDVLLQHIKDYGDLRNAKKTNKLNLHSWFSFQIGKYKQ